MCRWLKESNRTKHLLLAIPIGLVFTMLCILGVASGMEFKDVHHANGNKPIREWSWMAWDWLDWLATMLGGLVGQAIQLFIVWTITR
jgi:hypothetical protein